MPPSRALAEQAVPLLKTVDGCISQLKPKNGIEGKPSRVCRLVATAIIGATVRHSRVAVSHVV